LRYTDWEFTGRSWVAASGLGTLLAIRDNPMVWTSAPGGRDGVLILTLEGPLVLGNTFAFQKALAEIKPGVESWT
jgi:hypothetical protein